MIYNFVLLIPAFLVLSTLRIIDYYAGLARRISFVQMGWGFGAVAVAVLAEGISRPSNFWYVFPFQNLLLPVTVVVTLTASAWLQLKCSLAPLEIQQKGEDPTAGLA